MSNFFKSLIVGNREIIQFSFVILCIIVLFTSRCSEKVEIRENKNTLSNVLTQTSSTLKQIICGCVSDTLCYTLKVSNVSPR